MSTIILQRDLVVSLKQETSCNICLLYKLYPMFPELSRSIFKENALEKPTKTLFNNLSYYLVSIIDPNLSSSFTWPLFDSKAERSYRNELSKFITNYSNQGLVTPIISSYLVNPACFKVTVLLFELSQLAVKQTLTSRIIKDRQKESFQDMTEKYKSKNNEFLECVNEESKQMHNRFSNYLSKRKTLEHIAQLFRKKITDLEASTHNAQQYINKLIDDFTLANNLEDSYKTEILKIKNVNESSQFFDSWLKEVDKQMDSIENKWEKNVAPYLETCQCILDNSKSLINKHTGQTEKSSYMIEYNPKDKICTKDLQSQVNSQQQYVLKNLDIDGKLDFPNLIRAFVICVSFVLRNTEISNRILNFNYSLEGGKRNYSEFVSALRIIINRVMDCESKLQQTPVNHNQSRKFHNSEIPPLPDLSDLNTNYIQFQTLIDTFTPLNPVKHFNLTSKYFSRPLPKLIAPMYQAHKDDFLRSLASHHMPYDTSIMSYNNPNISVISSIKANETIAECSSGFTKQQILRLLSTKKTSSSKKHKFNYERPNIKIKKGGLFNDTSIESNGLYRSYSSPNLFQNRENRSYSKVKARKLSVMQEDNVSQLELSGIACLDMGSNLSTPQSNAESSRQDNTSNVPLICVSGVEEKLNNVITNIETEMKKFDVEIISPILEIPKDEEKTVTPKPNPQLIKKTRSLEKIINRLNKVRANAVQTMDVVTIVEEKENLNTGNMTSVARTITNRVLLPDLLSPSCNSPDNKTNIDYLDQICQNMEKSYAKKPRESLGTALGVDHTILDEFNLID